MFKFFQGLRAARDGDKMLKIYQRALNSANQYLPIKLGPGNAKVASAMLNEILNDDVFQENGVNEFRAQNKQQIAQKAKSVLEQDPLLRQLMIHTLWVKWLLDKAINRNFVVLAHENGWAFELYSAQYSLLPIKDYDVLVTEFENQTMQALGNYLESHSKTAH